jgi:hypothetical protein
VGNHATATYAVYLVCLFSFSGFVLCGDAEAEEGTAAFAAVHVCASRTELIAQCVMAGDEDGEDPA